MSVLSRLGREFSIGFLGLNDSLLPNPYLTGAIAFVVAVFSVWAAIPILKAHREQIVASTPDSAPLEPDVA